MSKPLVSLESGALGPVYISVCAYTVGACENVQQGFVEGICAKCDVISAKLGGWGA
jgi:hypothetical protein